MMKREPGEETVGVGKQKTIYGEVTANCHQPIFLTQMRIREPEILI